ncbi:cAMP-specific 3',5'-cyclic phosphodiesterase 4D isoform X2 [Leucoraja erinacea]|uniref:cAMP-specific 3',5'-cyclic phosphodiesterase 4D isoform X2 n=1 Tax=Leucoraja erinaceus TaxID=7782 RepID=UPI002453F880|nr:cAMP-specific 3',5'-cyclic phosphodiesterase 4D isoform X2 [Leucoraja erinacea]
MTNALIKQSTDEMWEPANLELDALSSSMEPYLVRRLSFHALQLPPLAFRVAEQYDLEKKSESEHVPRPTTLPLKTLPLIAITAADNTRANVDLIHHSSFRVPLSQVIMRL